MTMTMTMATIYAHTDPSGQRYARELADALDARGIQIRIIDGGGSEC
jgi:hypothetical protein